MTEVDVYECFHRTWWKKNNDWPNGLEPHAGRKNFYFKNKFGSEHMPSCQSKRQ